MSLPLHGDVLGSTREFSGKDEFSKVHAQTDVESFMVFVPAFISQVDGAVVHEIVNATAE